MTRAQRKRGNRGQVKPRKKTHNCENQQPAHNPINKHHHHHRHHHCCRHLWLSLVNKKATEPDISTVYLYLVPKDMATSAHSHNTENCRLVRQPSISMNRNNVLAAHKNMNKKNRIKNKTEHKSSNFVGGWKAGGSAGSGRWGLWSFVRPSCHRGHLPREAEKSREKRTESDVHSTVYLKLVLAWRPPFLPHRFRPLFIYHKTTKITLLCPAHQWKLNFHQHGDARTMIAS